MRELVFTTAEERRKKKADESAKELAGRIAPLLSEKARLEQMLARPDNGPMFSTLVQAQLNKIKEELKLIDGVATE